MDHKDGTCQVMRGETGERKRIKKHDTVAGLKDREIRIEEKAKQGDEGVVENKRQRKEEERSRRGEGI